MARKALTFLMILKIVKKNVSNVLKCITNTAFTYLRNFACTD